MTGSAPKREALNRCLLYLADVPGEDCDEANFCPR